MINHNLIEIFTSRDGSLVYICQSVETGKYRVVEIASVGVRISKPMIERLMQKMTDGLRA